MHERSSSTLSLSLTLLALLLAGLIAAWQISQSHNRQLEDSLTLILQSSQQSLQRWQQAEQQRAREWAGNADLQAQVAALLSETDAGRQRNLRDKINLLLRPLSQGQFTRGFVIFDPQLQIIAADRPEQDGRAAPLRGQTDRLARAWSGRPTLSALYMAEGLAYSPLQSSGEPTLFALAPLGEHSSKALLAIELNLNAGFFPILSQARLGHSGETYLFDRAGIMQSESRFSEQLVTMGLIKASQSTALRVKLLDPGRDLRRRPLTGATSALPLTLMAQSAIRGETSLSTDAYRDYRGIAVVGAWTWDQDLDLGLTSEIDADEAFAGLYVALGWLSAITCTALVLVTLLFTQVRRHQRSLAKTNTENAAIMNNAPAFILVRDLENHLLYANREAMELFGAANPGTLRQRHQGGRPPHLSELLQARYQQFIQDKDELVLQEKLGFTFDANIVINQSTHHFRLTKFPLRDDRGKVYAIGISGVDVTERMSTEQKLRDKELFQANLMANLPGAVYRCDLDQTGWHLRYISHGCLELLGHSPEQLMENDGRLFDDMIHPEDRELVREKIRYALHKKQAYEIEYRLNQSDRIAWLWARGRLIEDQGGTHTEGFLSDITERKLAERELAAHRRQLTSVVAERTKELDRERERLADIIKSAADGIISFDQDHKVNLFSPSALRILGLEQKNLTGMPVLEWFTERSQKILRENLEKLDKKQPIKSAQELRIVRSDGETYKVEVSLSRNATHGTVNYTLILRDISLRLEQQRALKTAMKNAEEASLAKSQFLANISHEIRTPLNAIIGMSQLTLNTSLTQKQLRYLKTIEYSSHTLLGVINDVLDFSKIEAGKLQIEAIPFNLEASLEAISQMTALRAQEKGVDFLLDIDAGVPSQLIGDPLRLSQILTNLCSNATKFTEQGHVTLGTHLRDADDAQVTLEFFVEDTGIGLTQEQQGQLFQAFSQADPSVTRRYGGTGLGLSICRELVRLMNSEIAVTSTPGQGSRFSFTLTLQRDLSGTQPPDRNSRSPLSVLLVEDNQATARIIRQALENMGHQVCHCEGGEQALARLGGDHGFNVLLVDWQLPGMQGDALITRVKSQSEGETPVVVMITAFEESEAAPVARSAGADALLIKPISGSTLFDTLENLTCTSQPTKTLAGITPVSPFRIPPALRGARLLLVEDNEINQEIAREIFESAGFTVLLANNGQEAVDWFAKNHADLILMDVQMPVLDGESATRRIRRTEKGKRIPIVAMTANAMKEDEQRCLDAGMNDYLTKPINIDKAITTVCHWLETCGVKPPPSEATSHKKKQRKDYDALPPLPGLDTHRGLINCSGNPTLYIRLLREFAEEYAEFPRQIMQLLDADDFAGAHQKTHSLKGVSGNLGANLLYEATKNLDNNIRSQTPDRSQVTAQLFSLNRAFQQLQNSIQQL